MAVTPNVAWNPADRATKITLSNENTTATKNVSGGYAGARANTSHSTGLRYFEVTVPPGNEGAVGLATSAASLSSPLGYGSSTSVGLYDDGTLWANYNSYGAAKSGPYGNTRVGFLVDVTARKLWIKEASGIWIHGGDPSSGGAGIDIAGLSAALFPMMTGYFVDDKSTLYSNPETVTLGLPANAALWGDQGASGPATPSRKRIRSAYWF